MGKKKYKCLSDAIIKHKPLRKATENLLAVMYPKNNDVNLVAMILTEEQLNKLEELEWKY